MKAATRYLVHVLALVVLLQVLLIGITLHYAASRTVIDTYEAFGSIYSKSVRMAVYATPLIAKQSDKPQLIIFGVSDGLLALRPEQLSGLTYLRVHNIATEQQNVASIGKLLDLIYQQTPRENWPNLNFIVAASATAFKSDAFRWKGGPTDIELEMMRYGAFYQTSSGIKPLLGTKNIGMSLQATLPLMLPYAAYSGAIYKNQSLTVFLKSFLDKHKLFNPFHAWFPTDEESNSRPSLSMAQREEWISYYNRYVGPSKNWDDKGLQQLEQIAARVSAAGGHFFFVDLPTAKWLQNGLHFQPYYQKQKRPYLARMEQMPRVHYINLQQGFSDDAFYDGAHTRAAVRPEIARRVAGPINRALALE